ncbi:WD repeat-containing protein on Y chromosome isoform X2 [Oryzias latipes]|uniref:WD repeat-containing protein on Y chromosome isoform X2 n=1 Tax=Oryzias latipes TaxID=8090 RepID=UPI000CE19731|nr:WD repeat-containing protein on Y chromosome isoform X2 [Oryzias latipes]
MAGLRNWKDLWMLYETEEQYTSDQASGASPAEKLDLELLQRLLNAFNSPKVGLQTNTSKGRSGGPDKQPGIKLEEFKKSLSSVTCSEESWIEELFCEIDISHAGEVTWQQLCSYLLQEYKERQRASTPPAALLDAQPQFTLCSQNKREPTVRILSISQQPPLRYITVSKGGHITVWSSSLRILQTFMVSGDPEHSSRLRGWVTDAAYMRGLHRVAIVTDHRDAHFVKVSPTDIFEDVHLFGFRCVLTAVCFGFDSQRPEQPPLLLLGDEKGGVHLMWFLNTSKGLFKRASKTERGPQRILFSDLDDHDNMVSCRHIANIHRAAINRVMFDPGANVIMTSSESETTSVVFMKVSMKQEPYIWKFSQGALCFDYSSSLQLLVTGGKDRKIRLWSRYVTFSPLAVLQGHQASVMDVAIYQPVEQIFSYSRDSELRVWDVSTHVCLKTIPLQFPCLQPSRIPEHATFPFLLLSPPFPEQTYPHLIVCCKDYLARFRLARKGSRVGGWLTAEGREFGGESSGSVSCTLYNPTLRQVVTGHSDSSVCLWDVQTGRMGLCIFHAHGEKRLTRMELDSSHRKLITAASNGTIKVWNLLNGHNLLKLEPFSNSEVTGLVCLHDNQLLAAGWSQQIVQYDIAKATDSEVNIKISWESSEVSKSNIVTMGLCASLGVVATANHDGDIIIWRIDTQKPLLQLHNETQEKELVDSLLFLQPQARNEESKTQVVLVSSQAGCVCFRNITGEHHVYGKFYVPEQLGQRVLSLSSDQNKNSILVSGDTTGCLQIWDISSYALELQHEPFSEKPPLLQRWTAYKMPLRHVEVLEVADMLLILAASDDGSAGLWTTGGKHVGHFGQKVIRNIADSTTYLRFSRPFPVEKIKDPGELLPDASARQGEKKRGICEDGNCRGKESAAGNFCLKLDRLEISGEK